MEQEIKSATTTLTTTQNLRDMGLGVEVISKILRKNYDVTISPATISRKTHGYRTFYEKNEVKHKVYNTHLRSRVKYWFDGWRLTNTSIKHGHHSRTYLSDFPRYIIMADAFKPIAFKQLKSKEETWKTYAYLVEENRDKLEDGAVLHFDRYYRRLTEYLEGLGYQVCVSGKTKEHPYHAEVEQLFSNVTKTIRELLKRKQFKWLRGAPRELKGKLTHAYLMAYWFYNDNELQEIHTTLTQQQKEPIAVKC